MSRHAPTSLRERSHRVAELLNTRPPYSDFVESLLRCTDPIIAPVCSRVGHDPAVHRQLSRQLVATAEATRSADAVWLLGRSTAVEPWASHAARVFGIQTILLGEDDVCQNQPNINAWVIAIADRVDALRVRRSGTIAQCLEDRLRISPASVRIAASACDDSRTTAALLDKGAVGRYLPEEESPDAVLDAPPGRVNVVKQWPPSPGEWLIHCTRSAAGPWPHQSSSSYLDDLLLSRGVAVGRRAIDCLVRIVRSGRLVAGMVTSQRADPVVCFAHVPLPELLARRAYRPHLKRWDYEPFGIAIHAEIARDIGLRPVTYVDSTQHGEDVPMHLRVAAGRTYDWRREREWRHLGTLDLTALPTSGVAIFVPDQNSLAQVESVNRLNWPTYVVDDGSAQFRADG
ncbi:MAG: hypothetical protein AAGC97_01035 [Planctomycetota bacterium]